MAALLAAFFLSASHADALDPAGEEAADERILCEGNIPPGPLKPLVQAEIAGKDHLFIFDTGSRYPLLIDKDIGPDLGAVVSGIGSKEHVQGSYALPEIKVGRLTLPPSERPGMEIGMFKELLGIRLDGIIGWPALAGNTLFLDHDHNRFEIIQGDWRLSPDSHSILIVEDGERPYLKLPVGDSTMKFLIDTGSDSGITLNDDDYDRLTKEGYINSTGNKQKTLTTSGIYPVRNGHFIKGSLLGIDLKGFPVNTDPQKDNILGELFLLKLNVSMSSSARRFDYKIRSNPVPPISTAHMLGTIFTYDNGVPRVFRLKDGGAGQIAGLEVGDVVSSITEIGDRPINTITLNELCREKAGQTIHLKIRRNGSTLEKELKLPAAISAWN